MSRVRRVADQHEMERLLDEFLVRGYEVTSRGATSVRLRERDWGEAEVHVVLVALTGWWTFGLSNALYAVYRRATAEEVVIKLDGELADDA